MHDSDTTYEAGTPVTQRTDDLHRRENRRRVAIAVTTFVLVALMAGGATAWLTRPETQDTAAPAGISTTSPAPTTSTEPAPSESATAAPTTGKEELPNQKSDKLNDTEGAQYWIWAPPTAEGKRMLTVETDGTLSLSRSNKAADKDDWLNFRGELALLPVGWNQYQIMSVRDSEEADAFCVTVLQAGFALEACDDGDEKQAFAVVEAKGGYTFEYQEESRYLMADGREITWTDSRDEATVFALEGASG